MYLPKKLSFLVVCLFVQLTTAFDLCIDFQIPPVSIYHRARVHHIEQILIQKCNSMQMI